MSGPITTGNHPAALWPGVERWWGVKYNEHPKEWSKIFDERNSKKKYEEEVERTGFGLAPVKAEGSAINYDSETQGNTARYTHVAYALGFIVTKEERDDNLYKEVAFNRTESLAFSMRQTEENVAANILNRGFNSSYAGADGKELFATDHPSLAGDQANELSTAADLSESSLEDMLIQIMQVKNKRGLKIALMGKSLIVPPSLYFDACRIVKSTNQPGTANNDINVINREGLLPGGVVVNHYLTDNDAWFVKTNAPAGLTRYTRTATEFGNDNDFDTKNAKAAAYMRFAVGWTDWRGAFGSPGA